MFNPQFINESSSKKHLGIEHFQFQILSTSSKFERRLSTADCKLFGSQTINLSTARLLKSSKM